MKNLLLILLTIPLMFGSCKKDDDDNPSSDLIPPFEFEFGNSSTDKGFSVKQTTDRGFIIVGQTFSSPNVNGDVYLLKVDLNGIEEWSQTFGNLYHDVGQSVEQTNDGGYIICGGIDTNGIYFSGYLIKTDENGLEEWSKIFGGNGNFSFNSVEQTNDGGYILVGYNNSGNGDINLVKTDGSGNETWSKTFGGLGTEQGFSVKQTNDGGYIITGETNSFGNGSYDMYLIKTDSNGDSLWTRTFGGPSVDQSYSVQQTNDGGYILTGVNYSIGNGDVYLVKTDNNGLEQWNKTLGGSGVEIGYSVEQTNDGGYVICGSNYENSITNMILIKTDGSGNEQWNKTHGDSISFDMGYSLEQTDDNGYVITGWTGTDVSVNNNVYLIKTDENGDVNP